jgi:hypothetical protein
LEREWRGKGGEEEGQEMRVATEEEEGGHHGGAAREGEPGPLLLRSPLRLLCFMSSVDTRCWLCVRKKERGKREKKEEKDGKKKG